MNRWIKNVHCIEELKQAYFALAKQYHSDVGGNDEIMKQINAEYSELHKRLKDIHKSVWNEKRQNDEEYYTARTETQEVPEDFINIVSELLKMNGLDIELCGRWLWIGGETKKHSGTLKKLGCGWHPNKLKWSWHYAKDGGQRYKGKKPWTMEQVRSAYGSEFITGINRRKELEESAV